MHIAEIITADTANGLGIRVSVFVSGCTNRCKGCFQPQTWDFEYGQCYTKEIQDYILNEVSKPFYKGLSVLGGEPFEPQNQYEVACLIHEFKKLNPDKDVWVYTGFTWQDLQPGGKRHIGAVTDEILKNIDVLVDGKFEEDLKDITLKFRGSSNQRIIDVKKTLLSGEIAKMQL